MKNLLIIGNWKENKNEKEALDFFIEFQKLYEPKPHVKVIICPQSITVPQVLEFIKSNGLEIELGVQDISKFEGGAHTGELSAREAKDFVSYSIIGHSERRAEGETDEDVLAKVELATRYTIEPIVCVVNENIPIPAQVSIVAYEPIEAIGTGNPDTPENAERIASLIKTKNKQVKQVLYGGSVNSKNVKSFISTTNIDGVLVGGASLEPIEFSEIIKEC